MIRYHDINSDVRSRRGYFMTSATFRKIPIGYNENIFKNSFLSGHSAITFYIQ
jgi:hypothetical protein